MKEEIKMKVKKETEGRFPNYDIYGTYHTTYKCPKCECTIHLDWHEVKNYCPTCGQKLDWNDCND